MKKPLHIFSVCLACATLALIFIGGLVKTTDSGLAVPDWPLSYGRLMPPMVGGVFYEHGHRMAAAAVGFLTIILAVLFSWKEDRAWLKKSAWAALGLVILQGVLGGMTVLFLLPKPISILHACLAQTFFCLVTSIAVWTSRFWRETTLKRKEPEGTLPLHLLAIALAGTFYIQLILGALLRHTGWGVSLHIAVAVLALVMVLWTARRIFRDHADIPPLKIIAAGLVGVLFLQIGLGSGTFFILIHRFATIPPPFAAIATVTAHVMVGALLLGLSVVLALIAYRTKPEQLSPLQPKFSDYFELTKPGISFMAGITALAGFVLGCRGHFELGRLIHTCVGTLMSAFGAGALNMVFEKEIDARMKRTQRRPIPSGRLNSGEALFLGVLFSLGSVLYLAWSVNFLTALFAGLTLCVYLYVYTPLKKVTGLCVTIGAVAGALPPVMGWTAATGRLGVEALVLFGILFFWQFPHFLSLAWMYKEDYAAAGLHMLPDVEPKDAITAGSVFAHSVALLGVSLLPTFFGLTGFIYLVTALVLGGAMSLYSLFFLFDRSRLQARRLFFVSLIYIPVLVTVMVLNK